MREFAEVVPKDSLNSIDYAHNGTFRVSDIVSWVINTGVSAEIKVAS